jgi:hypothetical protein
MRLLRLFLISIVVLSLVIIFVFSLFPRHIRISRYIEVPATKEKLASVIGDLRTWKTWNKLIGDSLLTGVVYSSPPTGEGAFLKSSQVDIILVSSSPDSIVSMWKPRRGTNFVSGFHIVQSPANTSIVEYYINFDLNWYPWEKLKGMFFDQQLGPLMEKSLLALKGYAGNP